MQVECYGDAFIELGANVERLATSGFETGELPSAEEPAVVVPAVP
jgi:hypothetical protein